MHNIPPKLLLLSSNSPPIFLCLSTSPPPGEVKFSPLNSVLYKLKMDGNMNTGLPGDETSVVLALPAQRRGGSNRSRQQSTAQSRAPVVGSNLASNYVVDVIVVDAGEGVGEKIQYYFQVHRRFPSQFRGHSCLCVIMSAQGAISCPRMRMRGSEVLFEGLYEIVRLSGFFFISNNRQVQLSGSLKLTFCDPDGGVFGGPVIGPLIAATPLQVAMLTFIHDP